MKKKISSRHHSSSARQGFTLIEVLIVLVIISILMALLFPAFKSAQERASQTNCATNLSQIYLAVSLYKDDEKAYPSSLAFLLANTAYLDDGTGLTTAAPARANTNGTGYLKSNANLLCNNDDLDDIVRSSYGDISANPLGGTTDTTNPAFFNRYVWNYYGYDSQGRHFQTADAARTAVTANAANRELLYTPGTSSTPGIYDHRRNPIKSSMSNRYAATSTIITRCVFHRIQTAANLSAVTPIHPPPAGESAAGARDIILRLDGTARPYDVSAFNTPATGETLPRWQSQSFR